MDVTIHIIEPDTKTINSLVEAQNRQAMVNKNN